MDETGPNPPSPLPSMMPTPAVLPLSSSVSRSGNSVIVEVAQRHRLDRNRAVTGDNRPPVKQVGFTKVAGGGVCPKAAPAPRAKPAVISRAQIVLRAFVRAKH